MGETISIERRTAGTVDAYGNPTYTTATISANCLVGFGPTNEPVTADGSPVTSQVTLYFPADTDVHDGDVFVIRGERFVKDGNPMAWRSVLNVAKGVVLPVRKYDG